MTLRMTMNISRIITRLERVISMSNFACKKDLKILHLVTGTLNERLVYMKAVRHASLNMSRFPGLKNNDVYFQMIDLDKGVYGHAFLVSLFLHVSTIQEPIWFSNLKILRMFVSRTSQGKKEQSKSQCYAIPFITTEKRLIKSNKVGLHR